MNAYRYLLVSVPWESVDHILVINDGSLQEEERGNWFRMVESVLAFIKSRKDAKEPAGEEINHYAWMVNLILPNVVLKQYNYWLKC